ncbi:MAG: patatin, partial [Ignavibacteriales bacterium CG_4_9_14_3_um_filter_34_10]
KAIVQPQNVFEILYRAEDITSFHLSVLRLREADLVIRPPVRHLTWADFDMTSEIIAAGEQVAKENLTEIKKLINRNSYLFEFEHFIRKFKSLS